MLKCFVNSSWKKNIHICSGPFLHFPPPSKKVLYTKYIDQNIQLLHFIACPSDIVIEGISRNLPLYGKYELYTCWLCIFGTEILVILFLFTNRTTSAIILLTNIWCVRLQDVSCNYVISLSWIGYCEVKQSMYWCKYFLVAHSYDRRSVPA